MSACNCMSTACCCRGGYTPRIGEYARYVPYRPPGTADDFAWIEPSMLPPVLIEPPPTRQVPNAVSWQCPGCLTWYAYWVSKCECQKRNAEAEAWTVRDGDTATLPTYGPFTSELD